MLRVKFADPGETWFYIDPSNSTMLSQVTRLSRIERWLYNGLHSLDFPFWCDMRRLGHRDDRAAARRFISSSIESCWFSRVARGVDGSRRCGRRPRDGAPGADDTTSREDA